MWTHVSAQTSVPVSDIIAVNYLHNANHTCCCPSDGLVSSPVDVESVHQAFSVHYVVQEKKNQWKYKRIDFKNSDPRHITTWAVSIDKMIKGNILPSSSFKSFIYTCRVFCKRFTSRVQLFGWHSPHTLLGELIVITKTERAELWNMFTTSAYPTFLRWIQFPHKKLIYT